MLRGIRIPRAKNLCGAIQHESAAILVRGSSAHSGAVAAVTAAEIADLAEGTRAGTIVATVAEIGVRIVEATVGEIGAAGDSNAGRAADMAGLTVDIITEAGTHLSGVHN